MVTEIESLVESYWRDAEAIRVLDAGCGRRCALDLDRRARITGIDVSSDLLDQNPALDERVVGSVETVVLLPRSFDIVVCWDVLEHLDDPDAALDNLAAAVREGGLLVLKVPNVLSWKGLLTKFTPYTFHRCIYRRFRLASNDPFPTTLRLSIAPPAIVRWARHRGFSVRYFAQWEAAYQRQLRQRLRVEGKLWSALRALLSILSLGRIDAEHTDCALVFEKA